MFCITCAVRQLKRVSSLVEAVPERRNPQINRRARREMSASHPTTDHLSSSTETFLRQTPTILTATLSIDHDPYGI